MQPAAHADIGKRQRKINGETQCGGANKDMAYGISNSINTAAGTYLTHSEWEKLRADLNNRNNPTTPLTEAQQHSSLSAYNPSNSANFGPWPQ